MPWFASCWDEASVDLIDKFDVPCYKIASASLTDDNLLRHTRSKGKPIILSTGMSTIEQIDHAVEVLGRKDLVILHAVQHLSGVLRRDQPACDSRLSRALPGAGGIFRSRNRDCPRRWPRSPWAPAWWNGTSPATAPCGAPTRPLRSSPTASRKLVSYIRMSEKAMGDGVKRVLEREGPIIKKLRRVGANA